LRRLDQAFAHIGNIALHAVETLHDANQGCGQQPDDDPE
jgi:hypothetical protein